MEKKGKGERRELKEGKVEMDRSGQFGVKRCEMEDGETLLVIRSLSQPKDLLQFHT